jgi:hypothetical protein
LRSVVLSGSAVDIVDGEAAHRWRAETRAGRRRADACKRSTSLEYRLQKGRLRMQHASWVPIFFSLWLTCSFGCTQPTYDAPHVSDEAALSLMLRDGEYRGAGFVRMNPAPYASALASGAWVTAYVSRDAAGAYQWVEPDAKSAGGDEFPVGGVIVREVVDSHGDVVKLTVMARRETGYYPDVGDFFFGVTDVNGTPLNDAGGHPQWGKLDTCAACHIGRASAKYLFGVSMADRQLR